MKRVPNNSRMVCVCVCVCVWRWQKANSPADKLVLQTAEKNAASVSGWYVDRCVSAGTTKLCNSTNIDKHILVFLRQQEPTLNCRMLLPMISYGLDDRGVEVRWTTVRSRVCLVRYVQINPRTNPASCSNGTAVKVHTWPLTSIDCWG